MVKYKSFVRFSPSSSKTEELEILKRLETEFSTKRFPEFFSSIYEESDSKPKSERYYNKETDLITDIRILVQFYSTSKHNSVTTPVFSAHCTNKDQAEQLKVACDFLNTPTDTISYGGTTSEDSNTNAIFVLLDYANNPFYYKIINSPEFASKLGKTLALAVHLWGFRRHQ